jgi:pre-mRNA-splicing factor CDC5/CEF1
MRILIKGGVWKNTEDEILKAAVMKYGKNQWARVASLLNRKSSKQCKARWYEWLDPSIKKTEWSKEEEEKLLHLAKLMPNQWRTIAPIVGRTAGQCMEQYERLLDQAQDGSEEAAVDDPRRLRTGEIDPAPETKPARPDPIDMDEDEKEMLSEARARLANTKGKKAKRKARERQLEESKRLLMLQKRRELKAAGIESKLGGGGGGKRKFIDYAREIPFQKVPPAGFYDVGDELEKSKHMRFDPAKHGMELSRLEGRHQKEEETRERQKDEKKLKALFKANAPQAVLSLSSVNDPSALRRRSALSLPAPQVSDSELEDIVKVGQRSSMPPPEGVIGATQSLIGDYTNAALAGTPMGELTQRTPMREDIVMQEARNLRVLREMTPFTSVDVDEDEELPQLSGGTGFEGINPRSSKLATPNVVLQTPGHHSASSTPGPFSTGSVQGSSRSGSSMVGRTPVRDQYHINQFGKSNGDLLPDSGDADAFSVSDVASVSSSVVSGASRAKHARATLALQLSDLPEPEYTYEVTIPETEATDDDEGAHFKGKEDAADVQRRIQRERAEHRDRELARRSAAVKRGLPRPSAAAPGLTKNSFDASDWQAPENEAAASSAVSHEMVLLLQHDAYAHPDESAPSSKKARPHRVDLDEVEDSLMDAARAMVQEELAAIQTQRSLSLEVYGEEWERISSQYIAVPTKGGRISYLPVATAPKAEVCVLYAFP